MIIIWIQYLDNVFCEIFLLNRFMILATVKFIQFELCNCLRIPDAESIYHVISITYNRHIIWNCQYRFVIFLNIIIPLFLFVVFHTNGSAKADFLGILITAQFKWIAIFQPVIRCLHLITIFNFLLKHSVMVSDSTSISRISQCCQRIQKARCQSSKTAISKGCVRFFVLNHIKVNSHLIKRLFHILVGSHVNQIIAKRTAHQKFH